MVRMSKAIFPVAVLVLLATASMGNALVLNEALVTVMQITGHLFCSPTGGSCESCAPLVGAEVSVWNKNQRICSGLTGAGGRVSQRVESEVRSNILDLSHSEVHVTLLGNGCPALSSVSTGPLVCLSNPVDGVFSCGIGPLSPLL